MAKRKAARAPRQRSGQAGRQRSAKAGRKSASSRKTAGRSRGAARKAAGRKGSAAKGRAAAKRAKKSRKPTPRVSVAKRTTARKRPVARKAAPARKAAKPSKATRKVVTRSGSSAPPSGKRSAIPVMRKAPGLDRERRIAPDEDIIQSTPPSSLDLDRSASAVRTGRRTMKEKFDEHTETSPAMTAGDVDADWESAYSVGDEAPGGDNPTPDQDIVDDIGRAVGVEYEDNEELKGEEKISKRDRKRWELDPASSEDYNDRD